MPHHTIVTQKIWVCGSAWSQKAQELRWGWGWAVLGGIVPLLCFLLFSFAEHHRAGAARGSTALQISAADLFLLPYPLSLTR